MPQELVVQLPRFERQATLVPESFNRETRTIDVCWTTGAQVKRTSFWSGETWLEELSLADGACDLARLNKGANVLDSHRSYGGVRSILGRVVPGSARVSANPPEGVATIRFSKRDEIADIVRDIEDGIIGNLSVGYEVDDFQEIDGERRRKEKLPPLLRAVSWRPCELSFVAVGADAGAQTRSAQLDLDSLRTHPCRVRLDQTPRRSLMGDPTDVQKREHPEDAPPEVPPPTPDPEKHEPPDDEAPEGIAAKDAAARAIAAERTRMREIRKAVRQVELEEEFAETLIDDGVGLDEARKRIFAELGKRQPRVTARAVTVGPTGLDTLTRSVEAILRYRIDAGRTPLAPEGEPWRARGLLDIGAAVLEARGVRTAGLDRMTLAGGALGLLAVRQPSGYQTTSDFALLLGNVARATLIAAYELAPKTFPPWTRRTTLPDFRPTNRFAVGTAPKLLLVPQHGEYIRGPYGATGGENIQLNTYGRVLAFTRQCMINDDLGVLQDIPQAFSAAAAQMESDAVYGILTGNPLMSDGFALFSTQHKNLATAATIDLAGMTTARALMRAQTTPDGQLLNLEPQFLIVGPAMEVAALQFVSTTVVPTKSTDVIPVQLKSLEVVVDGRITDKSWYLAASPAFANTIEYAYLQGAPAGGPTIETRVGFDIDGIEFKAREDFGAAAVGYRGLVKTPGLP